MLEHLIQSKQQHRLYNGPPNNMSLIVRGPSCRWNITAFLTWSLPVLPAHPRMCAVSS